ncbi:MAG: NUDIX domain-containing protein [Frankiaceae bacterium]
MPSAAIEPAGRAAARAARRAALKSFGRLPRGVRRRIVRYAMPSYTVGCLAVLRDEGRFLILRQRHRPGWTLPGGLLHRGELPADGLRRELREELGLELIPGVPAATLVDPVTRRVDVIYLFDLTPGTAVTPRSEEIEQTRWSDSQEPGLSPATRQAVSLLAEHLSARGQGSVLLPPSAGVGEGRSVSTGVGVVDLSAADVQGG